MLGHCLASEQISERDITRKEHQQTRKVHKRSTHLAFVVSKSGIHAAIFAQHSARGAADVCRALTPYMSGACVALRSVDNQWVRAPSCVTRALADAGVARRVCATLPTACSTLRAPICARAALVSSCFARARARPAGYDRTEETHENKGGATQKTLAS